MFYFYINIIIFYDIFKYENSVFNYYKNLIMNNFLIIVIFEINIKIEVINGNKR